MLPNENLKYHQNYHISHQARQNFANPTLLHIFCNKNSLQKSNLLKDQLQKNQIGSISHLNYNDCQQIIEKSRNKANKQLIILYIQKQAEGQSPPFTEKQMNSLLGQDNIKIISFPKPTRINRVSCAEREQQVVDICKHFFNSALPHRIKLCSVHSIKKIPSRTQKGFKSMDYVVEQIPQQYDTIYYQTSLYGQSDSKHNSLGYESVVQLLQEMRNRADKFQTLRDLEAKQIFKGKRKYLILTSTNEKSLRLVDNIIKKQAKNIDMILLGELKPSSQYLNQNIKLVTCSPKEIVSFLKDNGFDAPHLKNYQKRNSIQMRSMSSSGFKATMLHLMKESSQSSNNNIINSLNTSNYQRKKAAHHWMIDKEESNSTKFTTRQISKSEFPAEYIDALRNSTVSEVKEYNEQFRINNISSIVKAKQNDQIEKRTVNQSQPSEVNNMNARIYKHFPSNIIQQVSQQYRGSNKESIMNIEQDQSLKSIRHQLPSQLSPQLTRPYDHKKSATNFNNSSYRSIEHNTSQKRINYNESKPPHPQIQYERQNYYQNPQRMPNNGIKVYQKGNYTNDQPLTKIIRKQLTSPEEIKAISAKPASTYTPAIYVGQSNLQAKSTPYKQINNPQALPYTPTNYKAINSNRVSQVVSPPSFTREQNYRSPIEQFKNINQRVTYTSPNRQTQSNQVGYTNTSEINWDDYDKIESNGRIIYRKKVQTQAPQKPANQSIKVIENVVKPAKQAPLLNYQKTANAEIQPLLPKYVKNIDNTIKIQDYKIPERDRVEQPKFKPQLMRQIQSTPIPSVYQPAIRQLQNIRHTQVNKNIIISPNSFKKQVKNMAKQNSNLNDSNMFSRMSQLHSDGSILRRNNVRFGVKVPQTKKVQLQSSMQSNIVSGIYKANNFNKKNSLNKIISGEEDIEYEGNRLLHINTKFNSFHFIIHEQLSYLSSMIGNHIATKNDRIEVFKGIEQLFECIRPDKIEDKYDVGFIFVRKQEIKFINSNLFPDDYYLVSIEKSGEHYLEIDQSNRRMRMDQLKYIYLAQKIIIDSKVYQYVAYRNNKKEIQLLADKFMNTQFILEKIQTEFTSEIIDFYYCELPRITRLYLLCDEYELPQLLKLIKIYQQFNPTFNKDSCKLICVIGDILKNDELIMNHPRVTFISNAAEIKDYDHLLKYAHHSQQQTVKKLPIDRIFYHQKHSQLEVQLQTEFPGRFSIIPYIQLTQVYLKIDKFLKNSSKEKHVQKNYLILHEIQSNERVMIQKFTKVFMVGKIKVTQPHIIRVQDIQELFQLLQK